MKNIYLSIALLLLSFSVYSQINKKAESKTKLKVQNANRTITTGLAPSTAIFLHKWKGEKTINKDSLLQEFHGLKKDNKDFIKVFLICKANTRLSDYGFIQSGKYGRIRTGIVELEKIEKLAALPEVSYLEMATEVRPLLDKAITSSNVDKAHNGLNLPEGYTGDGVVVGIVDIGFDYTHPSFYDSTGVNYRVKRVWEQNATSGTPPSGYSYGRELSSRSTILTAQMDEASSHGTHVAGIAAGSGAGTADQYRGVAFESELVLVSIDGTNLGIAEGVDYIIKYANSVNKPCVINMSLGTHIGPHDGLSALDQAFDSLTGNGKLLVGAAGNEGQDALHIRKTYTTNDTLMVSFMNFPQSSLGTNGMGLMDIWGEPNDSFSVSINIYNTNTDQVEDFTPYISSNANGSFNYTIQDDDVFSDDCIVEIATEINPLNNKPHMMIAVDHTDQDDDYRWVLVEIIAHNSSTKMWCQENAYFTSNGYAAPFVNGSTSSTVGEIGGTGKSVISVGAYTTTNSYTNFGGNQQTIPAFAALEEIAPFSSKGPTADNRTKPDITAPGNVVIAPVSSFDPEYSANADEVAFSVTNGTKDWYFGALEGTSMASPMVAGILALWLEANPKLSPTKVRDILKNHSKVDTHTGAIGTNGDNTWGWGKIDALAGLVNIVGIRENELNSSLLQVYPNPAKELVQINTMNNEGVSVFISDLLGRIIIEPILLSKGLNQIDLNGAKPGIYLIAFQKEGNTYTHKLVVEL